MCVISEYIRWPQRPQYDRFDASLCLYEKKFFLRSIYNYSSMEKAFELNVLKALITLLQFLWATCKKVANL